MQTFKIHTLGCKVNQYDSQAMREQLERAGFRELDNGKKADYYIINTCTVTSNADRESRYLIRLAKRKNPNSRIVVTGCYAHSNPEDIKKIKGVDLVINNEDKPRIVNLISPQNNNLSTLKPFEISDFKGHARAFVKIQDGCDNFCSFCKVPYVRGRSQSREFTSIIDEVKRLRDKDYKEIVLTGICLGDYGRDLDKKTDLVDLISEIEKITGILRIRLSSIEARDISDKLIARMKTSAKLCPHLHIPFQSGDDEILKSMNRRDANKDYVALVQKLKKNIKDIAITTDIMIGFPGEDENKFLNTLKFLEEIEPARVHIFTFQPRDGTPLADAKLDIPQEVLKKRYYQLKTLTDKLSLKFKKRFLNRKLEILFEVKKNGVWQGHSGNYLLVSLEISKNNKLNLCNKIKKVRIHTIAPLVLVAA